MNNKQLGTQGEALAAQYLQQKGYRLLKQNYRCHFGEIDIIVCKDNTLVFVEVKTRNSLHYGRPGAAVNYIKQNKIIKTASWFLHTSHYQDLHCRFDVIEIIVSTTGESEINHLINAFEC